MEIIRLAALQIDVEEVWRLEREKHDALQGVLGFRGAPERFFDERALLVSLQRPAKRRRHELGAKFFNFRDAIRVARFAVGEPVKMFGQVVGHDDGGLRCGFVPRLGHAHAALVAHTAVVGRQWRGKDERGRYPDGREATRRDELLGAVGGQDHDGPTDDAHPDVEWRPEGELRVEPAQLRRLARVVERSGPSAVDQRRDVKKGEQPAGQEQAKLHRVGPDHGFNPSDVGVEQ